MALDTGHAAYFLGLSKSNSAKLGAVYEELPIPALHDGLPL